MFRVVTKISATRLNRYTRNGQSRLYKTIRHYSKQNEQCPPKKPKPTSGGIYTIGALTLITGATLAYAKYDPEFREWLKQQAPFTDDVLKFVTQEEKTYMESVSHMIAVMKASIMGGKEKAEHSVKRVAEEVHEKKLDYSTPKPIFPKIAEENKPAENFTEIRLEKKVSGVPEPVIEISGEKMQPPKQTALDQLAQLEVKIADDAKRAVEAFNRSIYAVKNYNNNVEIIVEESVDRVDKSVWNTLRDKAKAKDSAIREANLYAEQAMKSISEMKKMLKRSDLNAPEITIERTQVNMQKIQDDIITARSDLERELRMSNVTDKYWHKVEEARNFFSKELEALFPQIDLQEKNLNISDADMDLFVLHAMSKVLYYQKELYKLETVGDQKLNDALENARRTGDPNILTTEQICKELEKEKRSLESEYQTKCLRLRQSSEHELREKLKTQSEAFSDHLDDAVKTKEMEMERLLNRKFDEQLSEERCRFKMQVSAMVGRLRGMEEAMKARADADKTSHQAQILWSACQALFRSVKAGCPGVPWMEQLRPLDSEISAVESAAAADDELVKVVVAAIPVEAKERGVYPEDALRERFLKVEKVARSLALLPEDGGRLHQFFLSYLQSMLLLKATNPIPQAELNDQQVDFTKLSTNEILQRARYWLDRGDFAQTLKYMNLLKGAPRSVAKQWMHETKILLETQQAANTLMSYAAATGLMYM